jgi:hypothetical protein
MDSFAGKVFAENDPSKKIAVNGHLWVYARKFPPNWNCTPNLKTVFADLSYAGIKNTKI